MITSQSADVQTMVLNALHWDLAVPRHRVKVEVENGWVTMSGVVDRPYERTCAESDARRVPGVVGVDNQIRVALATAEAEQRPPATRAGAIAHGQGERPNGLQKLTCLEPNCCDDRVGPAPNGRLGGNRRHGKGDPRTSL